MTSRRDGSRPRAPWEASSSRPTSRSRGRGRGMSAYGPAARSASGLDRVPAFPFQVLNTQGEVDLTVSSGQTTDTSGNFVRHVPFSPQDRPVRSSPMGGSPSRPVVVDGRVIREERFQSPAVSSIGRQAASSPGSPEDLPTEFGLGQRMDTEAAHNTSYGYNYEDCFTTAAK